MAHKTEAEGPNNLDSGHQNVYLRWFKHFVTRTVRSDARQQCLYLNQHGTAAQATKGGISYFAIYLHKSRVTENAIQLDIEFHFTPGATEGFRFTAADIELSFTYKRMTETKLVNRWERTQDEVNVEEPKFTSRSGRREKILVHTEVIDKIGAHASLSDTLGFAGLGGKFTRKKVRQFDSRPEATANAWRRSSVGSGWSFAESTVEKEGLDQSYRYSVTLEKAQDFQIKAIGIDIVATAKASNSMSWKIGRRAIPASVLLICKDK